MTRGKSALPPAPYETAPRSSDALFVVRVGPLVTERDGVLDGYLPIRPDGSIDRPEIHTSAATALANIARRAGGLRLQCAPDLAIAGRKHGFVAAEIPQLAHDAAISFSLSNAIGGPDGPLRVSPDDAVELGRIGRQLHEAAPWEHWDSDVAVDVRLYAPDGRSERFSATIMGALRETFGFAIYDTDLFDAIATATIDPREVTGLSLTLETHDDSALNAFRAAFATPFFPMPARATAGRLVAAGTEDVFKLIAIGRALVQLRPGHLVARGELVFDNGRMYADVEAPRPGTLPAAERERARKTKKQATPRKRPKRG